MKRLTYFKAGVFVLFTLFIASTCFAWNQSFHAHVAKKCLGLDYRSIASYNARMGSIVPDFFWYLRDTGLIDPETADILHGDTSLSCVIAVPNDTVPGETTYFYEIASGMLGPWNYRLKYFAKGIRTHVYADIIAHNTTAGYLEGEDMWIETLEGKIRVPEQSQDFDREALHLALEFAVDALLIKKYGLQLNDLLFSYKQANFVDEAVVEALGYRPDFDVSLEFKKYLSLMRTLEKAASLYAPYLIRGEADEEALNELEASELLEAEPGLSEEGLAIYLQVRTILLKYPAQIYQTITTEGMHWEEDALGAAIDFCREPDICD